MKAIADLETQILALSPAEREHLATVAWESLLDDPNAAGNRAIDPDGVKLAAQRDREIESGKVQPIDDAEFRRRTDAKSE